MTNHNRIKSVAIIGAGAAGAVTAAAFAAENFFERIQVFERKGSAGGTWIYDPSPSSGLPIIPGSLPPDLDPPLRIPNDLPKVTSPSEQERFAETPIYSSLTTNVPAVAMSFSDLPFAYGPFVPHHIPRQYLESYFSHHKTDSLLSLNTTVEDVSVIKAGNGQKERWKLTLRKRDLVRQVDVWWEDEFDAVIFANGHYSVPFVPRVKGLGEYIEKYPGRVVHSKIYRTPLLWKDKRVLVIGNSASGHDVTAELISTAQLPVYQSRRSASRWDGSEPPPGIAWKPIVKEYLSSGRIIFDDDTYLDGIDTVIYCTGYLASFPFWNAKNNGREIWDYSRNKLVKNYLHTFFQDFSTLAVVGIPRVLTFRSFEYQAIALARLFAGRESVKLPPVEEQEKWEKEREVQRKKDGKKYHDIEWDTGETLRWLDDLYRIAGLPLLTGEGRVPPVLGEEVRWAIEHLRKYPEPGTGDDGNGKEKEEESLSSGGGWVLVDRGLQKDLLSFI
ncbi:hypothetical protein G7Y89_g14154 [Cudoniella acicularis]|uniref:Flavin-containing monooxygenase n=1 Tax=Cudoniella acicularis TaxID=354080 RepID=A0A8H4R9A4_9HELO|nr:hypothetical protein G7Y89_g14154 [Cudoniella acicularis]